MGEKATAKATAKASEKWLIEGAWFALEQAGRLLHSAVQLSDAGDAPTGLSIAMFAREELGRSQLLRAMAAEVAAGTAYTVSQVQARCTDHQEKQRRSVRSVELRAPRSEPFSAAMQTLAEAELGSPEWLAAKEMSDAAFKAERDRLPDRRHQARFSGIYVDAQDEGLSWARPVNLNERDAIHAIMSAGNDYAIEVIVSQGLESMCAYKPEGLVLPPRACPDRFV